MFRHLLSLSLLASLITSCHKGQDQTSRFHEDGRAKPVVAIASMLDTTSFDLPWSLSEEFTSSIVSEVGASGQIFIENHPDAPFSENPFGEELSWVKREFPSAEFVAFLELVEHEFLPTQKGKGPQESSTTLNMAVRLRVIDIRPQTPKIVLQEMVRDSYFIPKTLLPVNYSSVVWGSEGYRKSPMGIAHAQLIHEISERIGDYTRLAKSR